MTAISFHYVARSRVCLSLTQRKGGMTEREYGNNWTMIHISCSLRAQEIGHNTSAICFKLSWRDWVFQQMIVM
jgi:hypothetical protein